MILINESHYYLVSLFHCLFFFSPSFSPCPLLPLLFFSSKSFCFFSLSPLQPLPASMMLQNHYKMLLWRIQKSAAQSCAPLKELLEEHQRNCGSPSHHTCRHNWSFWRDKVSSTGLLCKGTGLAECRDFKLEGKWELPCESKWIKVYQSEWKKIQRELNDD